MGVVMQLAPFRFGEGSWSMSRGQFLPPPLRLFLNCAVTEAWRLVSFLKGNVTLQWLSYYTESHLRAKK